MSSLISNRAAFETARETQFGSITASFTVVGTPFTQPIRQLIIQNFTNQTIDFSISQNGANKHLSLLAGSSYVSDVTANKDDRGGILCFAQGDGVWSRYNSVAPTSGFVQVAAIYGK